MPVTVEIPKERWTGTIREVTVTPLKKDIVVELFGLAWSPVYAFKHADGWLKVAGFK